MGKIFLWMQDPPVPEKMEVPKWEAFLSSLGGQFALIVCVTVIVIAVVYAIAARTRKIHSPADLFGPYLPMAALSISLAGGFVMGTAAYFLYGDVFGDETRGALNAASQAGGEALIVSCVLGYLSMLLPGVTPAKFRYRPRAWFLGHRGA